MMRHDDPAIKPQSFFTAAEFERFDENVVAGGGSKRNTRRPSERRTQSLRGQPIQTHARTRRRIRAARRPRGAHGVDEEFRGEAARSAESLGLSPEMLAQVRDTYVQLRAIKEKEDAARLKRMEQRLSAVPDGWPPPPALNALMKRVPFIEEPERTRMLEEAECWTAAIVRAGTPRLAPTAIPTRKERRGRGGRFPPPAAARAGRRRAS